MMPPEQLPGIVAHADWSVSPKKRWCVRANLQPSGRYLAGLPTRVDRPSSLLSELRNAAGGGRSALIGFDFPIGLPVAYASKAGIQDFLHFLPLLGSGRWVDFYQPARIPDEISVERPFYPAKPGGAKMEHLTSGLGLMAHQLRRLCEHAQAERRAAAPLFWTLGSQQVGKAALCGWRDVLLDRGALSGQLSIWPFSGRLLDLLVPGQVTVAETYPADAYSRAGVSFSAPRPGVKSGKRSQADRAANAHALLQKAGSIGLDLTPDLVASIRNGFGDHLEGEDLFDSFVGLLDMIRVLGSDLRSYEPDSLTIRRIEGWILGMSCYN